MLNLASFPILYFPYMYHKNQPNVGKYTKHGWYGLFPSPKKTTTNDRPRGQIFEWDEVQCSAWETFWLTFLGHTGVSGRQLWGVSCLMV